MMVKGPLRFNDKWRAMTDDRADDETPSGRKDKPLSAAARRALTEAEQRRAEYEKRMAELPKEVGGRGGKEPGRYGDWEVKGIASDF